MEPNTPPSPPEARFLRVFGVGCYVALGAAALLAVAIAISVWAGR